MYTRLAFASSTNAIHRLRFVRLVCVAAGGDGRPAASSASCIAIGRFLHVATSDHYPPSRCSASARIRCWWPYLVTRPHNPQQDLSTVMLSERLRKLTPGAATREAYGA